MAARKQIRVSVVCCESARRFSTRQNSGSRARLDLRPTVQRTRELARFFERRQSVSLSTARSNQNLFKSYYRDRADLRSNYRIHATSGIQCYV